MCFRMWPKWNFTSFNNTLSYFWQLVKSCLGVYSVNPQHVTDHFHQFVLSSGGYVSLRSFLHLIWLCCIWVLWNERNQRLFANKANMTTQLIEKVKITSLLVFICGGSIPLCVWGLSDAFLSFIILVLRHFDVTLFCFLRLVLGSKTSLFFNQYISFWLV